MPVPEHAACYLEIVTEDLQATAGARDGAPPPRPRAKLVVGVGFALLVAVVLATIPLLAVQRETAGSSDRVGFAGFGRVHIGMSLWELLAVLDEQVVVEPLVGGCTSVYGAASGAPIFMVVDDRLARIEVRSTSLRTLSGVGVGDLERDILAAYPGRVEVEEHEYEAGHYLRIDSSDGRSAVVFDTDGTRVRSFRIGRLPEVLHVEGCA